MKRDGFNALRKFAAVSVMCATLVNGAAAHAHMLDVKPSDTQGHLVSEGKKDALLARLLEYVKDELDDKAYYEALANVAPGESERNIILGIAKDEEFHAEKIAEIIRKLSGKEYSMPQIEKPMLPANYRDALMVRIKSEMNDYKKYGLEHLAAKKDYIREFFYSASMDENIHAQRLQYLIDLTDK